MSVEGLSLRFTFTRVATFDLHLVLMEEWGAFQLFRTLSPEIIRVAFYHEVVHGWGHLSCTFAGKLSPLARHLASVAGDQGLSDLFEGLGIPGFEAFQTLELVP